MSGSTPVPRLLTPELSDRICEIVRNGNFLEAACSDVGINSRTVRTWKRLGREGHEPYASFLAALGRAEAASENLYVLAIRRAALTDWKAAAWLLEHRFNERWGYRAQITHTVEEEFRGLVDVIERELGPEAAARVFAAFTAGRDSAAEADGDPGGTGEPRH